MENYVMHNSKDMILCPEDLIQKQQLLLGFETKRMKI
jgi:hypothetical protein